MSGSVIIRQSTENLSKININIDKLPNGIYTVILSLDNKLIQLKFIKD